MDEVKDILLKMVGENSMEKKWFFPKNVDSTYKVILNMTLLEIVKYLLPAGALALLIASIPPYTSVVLWIIKLILIIPIIIFPIFYITYRPIVDRDNIKTSHFIKEFFEYKEKQKIYFKKPKKMGK